MLDGSVTFSRYAYPPYSPAHLWPAQARAMRKRPGSGSEAVATPGMAREYEGAWPYLQLIAGAAGIADPLDARVVEAYWVGSPLLDQVPAEAMGARLDHRQRAPVEGTRQRLDGNDALLMRPHHNFHVFGIHPWIDMLRRGPADAPLRVLDQCRVRWGRVLAIRADIATVRSRPLVWDGQRIDLGDARTEYATLAQHGDAATARVRRGDWCSLHWDWVCDRLTTRQLVHLRRYTRMQMDAINAMPVTGAA